MAWGLPDETMEKLAEHLIRAGIRMLYRFENAVPICKVGMHPGSTEEVAIGDTELEVPKGKILVITDVVFASFAEDTYFYLCMAKEEGGEVIEKVLWPFFVGARLAYAQSFQTPIVVPGGWKAYVKFRNSAAAGETGGGYLGVLQPPMGYVRV